jgi:hypothetical protein
MELARFAEPCIPTSHTAPAASIRRLRGEFAAVLSQWRLPGALGLLCLGLWIAFALVQTPAPAGCPVGSMDGLGCSTTDAEFLCGAGAVLASVAFVIGLIGESLCAIARQWRRRGGYPRD